MFNLWVQALVLSWMLSASLQSPGASAPALAKYIPASEVLRYRVEWRLIHAGNARLTWSPAPANGNGASAAGWNAKLDLESVGLVSRLHKVDNHYSSVLSDSLCIESSMLKAHEGSRRRETSVTFDSGRRKASYLERDLVKNAVVGSHEIDIRACEHDVLGALYQLRAMRLDAGQSTQIPVSDGKKAVMARVEAQQRERLKIDGVTYNTMRYEAFLFNNVLYRRSGRLFIWLTEDNRRLPVRIRVRLPFYIGTVTLDLEKDGDKS